MRAAVLRVKVDPTGVRSFSRLREGMAALIGSVDEMSPDMVEKALGREVEPLIDRNRAVAAKDTAIELCTKAFRTILVVGVTVDQLTRRLPATGVRR
ncbi:hypothetical protein F0Q45_04045 [Mycobacterium simiae]|uniref:Uncharacterized protein n=1 Tax=Mycobacterium simiae TaxID=1784 RepID=A0A5B1BVW5_MYCSI|nr:hypothetical protein [Mycobacterium simiae]KAA1251513.1 hypothetical protein F0Q45_04045 [Mycobacterium simiae]